MSSRAGSDRLATLRSVPPAPVPGSGSSSAASDPPLAASGAADEVAYAIGDPYHPHHHAHHPHARAPHSREAGGSAGIVWINSIAIGVLFIFLFIYILSHNVDSSSPAVLDATLHAADDDAPPPARDDALWAAPPPTPPPPRPARASTDAYEFLFHYRSGHRLAIEAEPADGARTDDDDEAAPPRRARTFYLVESDGASRDSVREMGALRPEDLASYQCCCYDKHVSVCQSAAPDLLPGYELACLLLYDDGGAEATGEDGEAWTLVVTLGRAFAPRHTYCRLGVQPLPAQQRPDARARDRLYPGRSRERRALAGARDNADIESELDSET